MGQQQLLLVVLGIIIVGIAVFVGINMFTAQSIEAKRNNVINDCVNLASIAQQYYRRPVALGGGGKSFNNWSIPVDLVTTGNGHYVATVTNNKVTIVGTGNEVVTGLDSIKVSMLITANDYHTTVIH